MPALKRTAFPTSYTALNDTRNAIGERNDCTVVAISLTTGVPYAIVHKLMAEEGRRKGRGAYADQWKNVVAKLGFRLREWSSTEMVGMLRSYPGANSGKGYGSITTHHPRRFAKQWKGTGKLLLWSHRHLSACIDGEVQDWAINRSKPVHTIFEVLPIEA